MTAATGPGNVPPAAGQEPVEPVRGWWSRHALNTGTVFALTVRGVRLLPRRVSYAIGHVGTWLAWRLMPATSDAIASNLAPLFPNESQQARRRRALDTYRSYAADTIDFLRALSASSDEARALFDLDANGGLQPRACRLRWPRRAAGGRSLRQLGDRRHPDGARARPAAHDRGDGRSRSGDQPDPR